MNQHMNRSPPILKATPVKLSTYTGEHLPILGTVDVTVEYNSQKAELAIIVVKGSGPNLLGRDWLSIIGLDWSKINSVSSTASIPSLETLRQKYSPPYSVRGLGDSRTSQSKDIRSNQRKTPIFPPPSGHLFHA